MERQTDRTETYMPPAMFKLLEKPFLYFLCPVLCFVVFPCIITFLPTSGDYQVGTGSGETIQCIIKGR